VSEILLAVCAVYTDLKAAGLRVTEVGAAADLEVFLLAGRPSFNVNGLHLEVSKVTGAAFESTNGNIECTEEVNGILPELRRARLTINYEIIGRDDEQIMAQYKADPKVLSVDELLYAAVLTENKKEQEAIYATTTKVYPNDARAYNNIATIAYSEGNYSKAKEYAEKALKINANCNEATANLGLIALKDGKVSEAEALIAKASGANGIEEVIGNLNLAKGNYAQAEYDMRKAKSNSAALAQILNNNYSAALQTLNSVTAPDGTTEYLKAIVYARQGNNNASAAALKNAIAKDSSWAKYAANDLELSNVSK
jgi:tetratricopeptide (TPR) repeat protein